MVTVGEGTKHRVSIRVSIIAVNIVTKWKQEDSSPAKKQKRKRVKEKKAAPEPTAAPKEEKERIKRAQNIVRLNNQAKEAEAKLAEEKRLKEKALNDLKELRESPPIDFEACSALSSLKNDIIVFYATKFESMEPKEKKNTDLKGTIPTAICRHFTDEDFKPY